GRSQDVRGLRGRPALVVAELARLHGESGRIAQVEPLRGDEEADGVGEPPEAVLPRAPVGARGLEGGRRLRRAEEGDEADAAGELRVAEERSRERLASASERRGGLD